MKRIVDHKFAKAFNSYYPDYFEDGKLCPECGEKNMGYIPVKNSIVVQNLDSEGAMYIYFCSKKCAKKYIARMTNIYQKEVDEIMQLLQEKINTIQKAYKKIDSIQKAYKNGDKQCTNLFDKIKKTINEFFI